MGSTTDVPSPDSVLNADRVPTDGTLCIVAGSRSATDVLSDAGLQQLLTGAIEAADFSPDAVVSGTASGVDTAGETWATERHLPVAQFPADWDQHGRAAGPIRNKAMARYADAHADRGVLLAVIDYPSSGTESMIEKARRILGDENVFVVPIGENADAARGEFAGVLADR